MRTPPLRLALTVVLLATLAAGCQLITIVERRIVADDELGPFAAVSLGIYSGRPDPSWPLTESQSAHLDELLAALPSKSGSPPEGGLGYHGFSLIPADRGPYDRELVAYRGTVGPVGSTTASYLLDVDRVVERFLLETGRPHLSAEEVAVVEADLATPLPS
jgi:hypothetical protein